MRRAAISASLAVFLLNLWVAQDLLRTEYISHMWSIEGTHIAIARWVLAHATDLSWFPLWYGGIPFQNAYPPLHHIIVALAAAVSGASPALSYHATTAVFYSLGPVTLFWLALRLSRSLAASLAAAVMYSLLSPASFLMHSVREDIGGIWRPRRLHVLVTYGDAPHIAAMTMLPLALLLLMLAFEKRRPLWWTLAGLGLIGVVITNWLGAMSLALAVGAWMLATLDANWRRRWAALAALAVCAYVVAMPWIPLSTMRAVAANEQYICDTGDQLPPCGEITHGGWIALPAIALAGALLVWAFRRWNTPLAFRFPLLFLVPTASLSLLFDWGGIRVVPQPHRFQLEMEIALVLLAAFSGKLLCDRLRMPFRIAAAAVLLLACIYPAVQYRRYARDVIRPIDVRQTVEFREAQWFAAQHPNQRVLAPGSIGFWLNVFTNVPQFGGGFYQGNINPAHPIFFFHIFGGRHTSPAEKERAVATLRAFGIDAVGISGSHSPAFWKIFQDPAKFEGVLLPIWRDGDDVVYDVPRRSRSLAHVVPPAAVPARQPRNALDFEPVQRYVDALEKTALPTADFRWTSPHSARIATRMERGQVLSVQISHHPGWRATANGLACPVRGDGLGQMVVEPSCAGDCSVELTYDGGPEMRFARVASWTTLGCALLWVFFDARKRVLRPRPR